MNKSMRFAFSLALWLGVCAAVPSVGAPWDEGLVASPDVPSPDEFLGRPLGERHMSVNEIASYCRALAASTDRVELVRMGRSVQGEPLLLLSIASPHGRRVMATRTSDMATLRDAWGTKIAERRAAASRQLPVVWIGCSVHGDEASGADAGVALAYRLAADESAAGRELLDRVVVLVDPMQNPDGRRRFLQHVRSFGRTSTPDPSPFAAEHNQLWPGGRSNHFLFDMNRDWAFQTQPETRARAAEFLKWRPQVFVDLHEMGRRSSYYFPPPSEPINPNVPETVLDWFDAFGRANAQAFEVRGYDYFVRETFDLFYPGYGDSWPTLQGAIGMTFEQASTRGRRLVQRAGRVVGYADAVAHHYVAARTTVETAATYGQDLLQSVVDFYEESRRRAEDDPRRELVLSVASHPRAASRLAELLAAQGVEVRRTLEDAALRLREYDSDRERRVDLPAGSLLVPLRQANYALLRSLVDPETELSGRFLAQEEERRRRGLSNRFYDVTAWSLVYSYGVQAYWSFAPVKVATEELGRASTGASLRTATADASAPRADARDAYAWLLAYRDPDDVAALSELWRAGITVATSLEAFEVGGKTYPRGSLVIPRAANAGIGELASRLETLATRHQWSLDTTPTGWSDEGPSLGSSQVRFLSAPRIGLLTGPGLRPLSAGANAWLLEQRYGVAFTSVLLEQLDQVDLRQFDALLLPEVENGESLPGERLLQWVEAGGVLVAVGNATAALLAGDEQWSSSEIVDDLAELADEEGMLGEFEVGRIAEDEGEILPDDRRVLRTPGAILRVEVDPTHPLSLGESGRCYAPYLSDRLLTPSIGGKNVLLVDEDDPRAAGFMWPVMERAVAGKAYLVEERLGRGALVLFAEDPAFRGVWEGLHRYLLNALLVRPGLLEG